MLTTIRHGISRMLLPGLTGALLLCCVPGFAHERYNSYHGSHGYSGTGWSGYGSHGSYYGGSYDQPYQQPYYQSRVYYPSNSWYSYPRWHDTSHSHSIPGGYSWDGYQWRYRPNTYIWHQDGHWHH